MRTFSMTALAVSFAGATAACATPAKFHGDRPVDVERGALGAAVYKQDGKPIAVDDILTQLESFEPARDEARAAEMWMRGGQGVVLAGCVALGYEAFSGRVANAWGWTTGTLAAMVVLGIPIRLAADSHATRAVNAHNARRVATTSIAPTSIAPWIAPLGDAAGRARVALGVSIGF